LNPQASTRPDSVRSVLGAAVLLALALLAVAGVKSHRDLAAARARERELATTIDATRGRIGRLRGRIERLRDDPGTLERLAREDLGLVRPNDVVIVLPAGATPKPPAALRPAAALASAPVSLQTP